MSAVIRLARPSDAAALLEIYAPIVRETAISFELEPPSEKEMEARIATVLVTTPWLVCEDGDALMGYAYAAPYHARPGYRWTVEVTVYVSARHQRRGVGKALYTALIACLRAQGYASALAGIALPNPASVRLHESLGFERVGVLRKVGYKLGSWHDVGFWQLPIGPGRNGPPAPRPVTELAGTTELEAILRQGASLLRV